MRVIAIIPARYESSRFTGKLLATIKTKPLIQWVYEEAINSGLFDEVVISSGDQSILDVAGSFSAKTFRNVQIHSCGTDRCAEAAQNYMPEDIIFNVQGDELLLPSYDLVKMIHALKTSPSKEVMTIAVPFRNLSELENPDQVKVVCTGQEYALFFSRSVIPYKASVDPEYVGRYRKHVGIYAFRNEVLQQLAKLERVWEEEQEKLEQLRWLIHGVSIRVVLSSFEHISINRKEDVKLAEYALEIRGLK